MNKESNLYTIVFVTILILVIATTLTLVNILLLPRQKQNMEIEKKQNILTSINISCSIDSVEKLYDKYIIDSYVVDCFGNVLEKENAFSIDLKEEIKKDVSEQHFPIFVAKTNENARKNIYALIGKGLWGEISGYVALDEDNNSIFGIIFNHKSETPGLGAEISEKTFQNKFLKKRIFNDDFSEITLKITKNKNANTNNEIDALSGATITSAGVEKMISDCMLNYKNYILKTQKK